MQVSAEPVQCDWVLRDGVQAEQRPICLNVDGNSKLNHIAECGAPTSAAYTAAGMKPQVAAYFGPASTVAATMKSDSDELQAGASAGTSDAAHCGGCSISKPTILKYDCQTAASCVMHISAVLLNFLGA